MNILPTLSGLNEKMQKGGGREGCLILETNFDIQPFLDLVFNSEIAITAFSIQFFEF